MFVGCSSLAKGLESDAVGLWQVNAKNYHEEDERECLYTVLSRASYRLTSLASPDVTPLLDKGCEELYERG